jgi:hypothetical protein
MPVALQDHAQTLKNQSINATDTHHMYTSDYPVPICNWNAQDRECCCCCNRTACMAHLGPALVGLAKVTVVAAASMF